MKPIKTVGVLGMGYVGVPAAALFTEKYDFVYGFQRKSETSGYKIDMLNRGECPFVNEPYLPQILKSAVKHNKFQCTSDFSKIKELDALTISIQTPFIYPTKPDYTALTSGLETAAKWLAPETLVVIESTVSPGFTQTSALNILESLSHLHLNDGEFFLAHAPERIMNGRLINNIRNLDRIIGGVNYKSTLRTTELYTPIMKKGKLIQMQARAAETTKVAENACRDLQIATANNLALYCEAMGINFYDVKTGIDSLNTDSSRGLLLPGAGVGGHCLTKDSYHLEYGLNIMRPDMEMPKKHLDFPQKMQSLFIHSRNINDFMPHHMFYLTTEALIIGEKLNQSNENHKKIALLGWAFNADTEDSRNSPSKTFYELFNPSRTDISIHDPYVKNTSCELTPVLENADAVVIFTGHTQYRTIFNEPGYPEHLKQLVNKKYPIIIDGRNIIEPDAYIDAGFIYRGIGRGDKNNHIMKIV